MAKTYILVFTVVLCCLSVCLPVASAQVERIWLTHASPDPSYLVVSWETSHAGDSTVEYGATKNLGRTCHVEEHVTLHHVEIPLDGDATTWFYRVQTNGQQSPLYSFKAYPTEELRVAVVANLQRKPDLTAVQKDDVHLLMTAGDNIPNLWQSGGDAANIKPYRDLIDAYPDLFRTTIFMPVLGNHDKEARPRGAAPPAEPVYDVEATAFRRFFALPGDEWKWHLEIPSFDVAFAALDLNHISDMGTTWQACHPYAADGKQFAWYDKLTQENKRRFLITLYNERNANIRTKEGGRWHEMFRRGTLCISGFGYFGERAVHDGHSYLNTSTNGTGDRYPDPSSDFLFGKDNYVLLTFHRQPLEMIVELKALSGEVLDRTRYTAVTQKALMK